MTAPVCVRVCQNLLSQERLAHSTVQKTNPPFSPYTRFSSQHPLARFCTALGFAFLLLLLMMMSLLLFCCCRPHYFCFVWYLRNTASNSAEDGSKELWSSHVQEHCGWGQGLSEPGTGIDHRVLASSCLHTLSAAKDFFWLWRFNGQGMLWLCGFSAPPLPSVLEKECIFAAMCEISAKGVLVKWVINTSFFFVTKSRFQRCFNLTIQTWI